MYKTGFDGLRAIYQSKAYEAVKFVPKERCWVLSEPHTRLRGVRSTLQRRAWPSYDYKSAEKNCPTPQSARVRTGVRSARGGSARGAAVHEQLHAIAAHGLKAAQRMYKAKNIDMEPLAIDVLKNFAQQNLVLVGAEMPVYDARAPLRMGSAIDLICKDKKDGRLVIIELKVGGDNYFKKYNAYMENELAPLKIENSPLNQALLQLTVYKMLFEQCYGDYVQPHQIESYRVVYVGLSGIVHQPLIVDAMVPVQAVVVRMLSAADEKKNSGKKNNKRKVF